MSKIPHDDKVRLAIEEYCGRCFDIGLEQGLAVAEKILNWLRREPDNKWQKEVRGWAEKEIKACKEKWR